MADDYIRVVRSFNLGSLLVQAADQLRNLRELVDRLKDAANHSNDGASFATMETIFGLPTGAGANATTLINLIDEILNSNVTVSGADRLSRLDEFCGRLSGQ